MISSRRWGFGPLPLALLGVRVTTLTQPLSALPDLLADLVVVIHFCFVLFVILGGLLVLRWRWVGFLHVPAALWGAWIELAGWVCPLTPLEQSLRLKAGEQGYSGSFIEHYVLPLLYPSALTRAIQVVLGIIVIAVNLGIYGYLLRRRRLLRPLRRLP
jgi:hypothetical protein